MDVQIIVPNKSFVVSFGSSNGKTVTWAQNERGYRPNLWKRISIHIKKKEEVNQTAIIKPFSKGSDAPSDSGVKLSYDRPPGGQRYPVTYRPRTPSPLPTVCQRASLEPSVPVVALPSYLTEHRQQGNPHQTSIMDQISSVVNRFTANISELNSMMLPPGSSSAIAAGAPPVNASGPCSPSFTLLPHEIQRPTLVTTYAEVVAAANATPCSAVGIAGGIVTSGNHQASAASLHNSNYGYAVRAADLDELAALSPPSPFRDSSVGSDSDSLACPDSELALCDPRSSNYDQLMLRNYSQSSSSL